MIRNGLMQCVHNNLRQWNINLDVLGNDVKLHPGVPVGKDSTLKASRARVTVKLLAARQWIFVENATQSY